MALPCVRLGTVRLRSEVLYRFLCRNSSHQSVAAAEEIVIPRKKTWDKTAVLQALAYTVNHDPTSIGYVFQDDPFLIPKSSVDNSVWRMSKESGQNAAKYIVNMYPNLFVKDLAEPSIQCLMPEIVQPQIEGLSEEALHERIILRRIKESVDLYDQLLQAGTPPSLTTTNRLLDLLCYYGDKELTPESEEKQDQENENANDQKDAYSRRQAVVKNWRDNNNAERIFNLMPEKDAHSFRPMIRGMVKHGAFSKAFDMYTDLLNNRLTGDVHTFNALFKAIPHVHMDYKERWAHTVDLLNHMVKQNVQPNLLTFNALLSNLRRQNMRNIAIQLFNEMRALKIEPSLATYNNLLAVFYKLGDVSQQVPLLKDILENIQGKCFTVQDPEDVKFFSDAMKICLDSKDLKLAYKLDALKNTGENYKLLGKGHQQTYYYGKVFSLLCLMEDTDIALKWYREHIPSRYYPNTKGLIEFLQLIEMENRLELLPEIWKDVYLIGHTNKSHLLREFLQLMTKEKQNPELQDRFADVAASIKDLYENADHFSIQMKKSPADLGCITILLCRAGRMEDAWKTLKSFQSQNLVPGGDVIEEVLAYAKSSDNTSMAIDLVQLATSYSLPNTDKLAKTVLDEFTLSEEQRITLQDLTSGSSSDSDWE